MPASSDFFGQRNPQAVLKHGVLTRYAHYFAGRAGSATGGRVAFVDGYAGEGRYEDGNPGSPLLLASQANRVESLGRDVKLAFVEQDDARRLRLNETLQENKVVPDQLLGGSFEEVVDTLLNRYKDRAVLLFIDPFGLAVDRSTLERVLGRSSKKQPIDVLYHFSLQTVARMGRAGIMDDPLAVRSSSQLDAALGAIDWRTPFEGAVRSGQPTSAAMEVARIFGESITSAVPMKRTAVPVRQRPDQLPKYLLMLFSNDEKAHWDFADVASKAHVDWLHHCDTADYEANVKRAEHHGVQQLFKDEAPRPEDVAKQLEEEANQYFPPHLLALLAEHGSVRPVEMIEDVYGKMLGRARTTHIRAALRALHASGRIEDDGSREFWMRTLKSAGG
jgi:three-Cys-motif partner protein